MTRLQKMALLCGIAALLTINIFSPVARADELRHQDKAVTEGNKGRGGGRGHGGGGRGHGGGGHGGGRHHGGGSGWAWAGLGAAVGLGILSAVTSDSSDTYYYAEPAPQVVYPGTTYYYAQPTSPAPVYVQPNYAQPTYAQPTYVQPRYVQPNYGQTYVQPAPPAPCNACP